MTTLQDRIIKKARKELGVKKIVFTVDGKTEESWFLDRETEQFLIQSIKEVEKETRTETIEKFKEVFDDWGCDSQYVTGSWNSGESDLDSEKKGDEYWDWWAKTAWEQFYDYYLKSITNKEKL